MGKLISKGVDIDERDRGGGEDDDKEWLERWLGKYHATAITFIPEMDKDVVTEIQKMLDVDDLYDR